MINNVVSYRTDIGTVKSKTFESACILQVLISDSGHIEGDSGHGCKTSIQFTDHGSTDMDVIKHKDGFTIQFQGGIERQILKKALLFILTSMEETDTHD